jgi:hypothetical protein
VSDPDPASSRVGFLRCFTCGKMVECQPDDRLRFASSGWPRCCRDVMVLLARDAGPSAPPNPPDSPDG